MGGYKELNLDDINEDEVELEFEEEEQPEPVKPKQKAVDPEEYDEEDEDEGSDSEIQEDDEEETEVEAAEEQPRRPKKRKNRAEKRIRQLSADKRELLEQLERERQLRLQAENSASSSRKTYSESQVKILDKQVKSLQDQMAKAMEEGRHSEAVAYSAELQDTIIQRRIAEANAVQDKPEPTHNQQQHQPQRQQQVNLPDSTRDWLEDNRWFMSPKNEDEVIKRSMATALSEVLINEGFDATSDEFYDELDARLEKKLGVAPQPKSRPNVGGGGRQAPARRKADKNKVILTREDRDMIERLGITPQEYARQKKKLENSSGGYTEIDLG